MSLTSTLTSLAAVASSVCALLAWGSYKPEMMITFLVAITSIELLSRSVSTVGNLRQEVSTLNREIESLQATTVRAKERARRHQTFDLAKSQFLAFSCHDLRKPLLELRDGLAHWDPSSSSTALSIDDKDALQGRCLTLLNTVDDILAYTSAEAEGHGSPHEPCDIYALTIDVLRSLANAARDRGIDLRLQWGEWLPRGAVVSAMTWRTLIYHLLDNAIRFSPPGPLHLKIEGEGEDAGFVQIRIELHDRSIGVLETMRHEFSGAATTNLNAAIGAPRRSCGPHFIYRALGLLVRELGATSHIETTIGSTARIHIRGRFGMVGELLEIPKRREIIATPTASSCSTRDGGDQESAIETPEMATASASSSGTYHDHGLRALVVDDNSVNRMLARRYLESEGYRVEEAAEGFTAVSLCTKNAYDIVLMDVTMPGMDGHETTRAIRLSGGLSAHCPIIAVTASQHLGEAERCISSGMNAFLAKPIRRETLLTTIREFHPDGTTQPIAAAS